MFKFRSTLPQGERLPGLTCRGTTFGFDPRSRRGSDNRRRYRYWQRCSFDPRSRRGSDTLISGGRVFVPVSIHAPAGGATSPVLFQLLGALVSIHAPAGGATCRD